MKPADLVRPEILALSAYPVADAEGMVKLDAMENPYRLPEPLARELASRLACVEINRYPNPAAPALRARLAEAMQIPAGCEVVLGNGSDDLIQIVTFTLARPGAVMLTVSKMSLAGLRLGYLVARPEWAVQFNKVRQVYNVNVLTQVAAEFALEHLDVLEEQAGRVLAERAGVGEALAALPGTTVYPSQANFFLVRVPDADRAHECLRAQGVLVRNFNGAHPMLANCLRVTVGTPEENRILITAMREALT